MSGWLYPNYLNSFSAGAGIKRQNRTSKDGPCADRVERSTLLVCEYQ